MARVGACFSGHPKRARHSFILVVDRPAPLSDRGARRAHIARMGARLREDGPRRSPSSQTAGGTPGRVQGDGYRRVS